MVEHQIVLSTIMFKNVKLSNENVNTWQHQKYARPETYLAVLAEKMALKNVYLSLKRY